VAKRTNKKRGNQRINKTMVNVVIIIAGSALLLSSALAYFGRNSFSPAVDPSKPNYELYIEDMEYTISQLEDSLEKAPENMYLLTQLGNSYYQLGLLYNSKGDVELTKESFAKAVLPYGKALEIEPENVDVRVDRAVSAFWSDNFDLAETEFQTATEQNPTHAKAFFNYGIFLLLGRNNAASAIEQWNQVLELNPADDKELVTMTRSWIGQAEQALLELKGDPSQFEEDEGEEEAEEETNN
jgi:tetratricopeptide (TPR) repeat protein